jgi:hypothetical protein
MPFPLQECSIPGLGPKGLWHVSKHSDYPQLAAANVIAVIIIIAILYSPCPAPKRTSPASQKL